MISNTIVATLVGVTGFLGLLSLLAYFLIGAVGKEVKPFDVHGTQIDPSVIKALQHLKTDKAKLDWLKHSTSLSAETAIAVVEKSKQFDPNAYAAGAQKSRDKRYLNACIFFFGIAFLGLLYEIIPQVCCKRPEPPDPIASGVILTPPKKPVCGWKDTQESGSPYSKDFPIKTHNRHNEAQVGQSGFIRVDDLNDPPNTEKRITSATYRCEGHGDRCGWSMNPAGGYEISYKISADKKTLTWQRSWDGDEVYDIYTVYYEVYRCVENCS